MQIGDITAVKEVVKEKMTKLLGLKSDADIEIKSAMKIGSSWSVVASVSKDGAKKEYFLSIDSETSNILSFSEI